MCNMQNCKITKYNLSWLYYYKSVILHITSIIPRRKQISEWENAWFNSCARMKLHFLMVYKMSLNHLWKHWL